MSGHFFHLSSPKPSSTLTNWRAVSTFPIGGGVDALRQLLVDETHVMLVPILLGRGERLCDGPEGLDERFDIETTPPPETSCT